MKAILYTGAALMIGASVYGFVDYRQTQHKKEFINLYKATGSSEETAGNLAEKKTAIISGNEKTATTEREGLTKKAPVAAKKKKKRRVEVEFFSRGGLEDRPVVPPPAPEKKQ